eukprot:TRINITY_DN5927_c0_g1_i1.p1 TRINITY_DN5927_c0_g1~~TRINITY_DN5927_c0_g1_i1.p1  ORF type:complete len:714 (+),score=161.31 TRINITY_DN5927_c0_g1_i1:56-2197(+)
MIPAIVREPNALASQQTHVQPTSTSLPSPPRKMGNEQSTFRSKPSTKFQLVEDEIPPPVDPPMRELNDEDVLNNLSTEFEVKPANLKKVKEMFHHLDADHSGELDLNEFKKALGCLGMQSSPFANILFAAFDTDNNGHISLTEFLCAMTVLMHGKATDKLDFAFGILDLDKSGTISKYEFTTIVKSMYIVIKRMNIISCDASANTFIDEFFEKFDTDKDGEISLEEYRAGVKRHPEIMRSLGLGSAVSVSDLGHSRSDSLSNSSSSLSSSVVAAEATAIKPPGQAVFLGHDKWNLVLELMISIRLSIQSSATVENNHPPPLTADDFLVKTMEMLPPRNVSKFRDYAPKVFRELRRHFGISDDVYINSLGPEQILGNMLLGSLQSLSEQVSEGKSGSLFYFSHDSRFLLKTISSSERNSLVELLPRYLQHVRNNPNTLLARYYGLHKLECPKHGKIRYIVMGNVFQTTRRIHTRYDLKGSVYGRTAEGSLGGPLKDLDFKRKLQFGNRDKTLLMEQIKKDVCLLEEHNIIDYSMLIGVSRVGDEEEIPEDEEENDDLGLNEDDDLQGSTGSSDMLTDSDSSVVSSESPASRSSVSFGSIKSSPVTLPRTASVAEPDQSALVSSRRYRLKSKSPGIFGEFQRDDGGVWARDENGKRLREVYYMGIIDVLIQYGVRKTFEHHARSKLLTQPKFDISIVPPDVYASRFTDFMNKIPE